MAMPEVQEHSQMRTQQLPAVEVTASDLAKVSGGAAAGRAAAVVSVTCLLGLVGTLALSYAHTRPAPLVRIADLGPPSFFERQLRYLNDQDPEQALTLHMSAGHVFRDQGQYRKAVEEYTAARDISARLGGHERLGASQQSLGLAYYSQGRLKDARRVLEAACFLLDGSGDHAASTLQALGNVRREMGHLDEALKLYKESWAVTLAKGDEENLPKLATDFGEAYRLRGDIDQATSYFGQAIKQREAIGARLHSSEMGGPETALTYSLLGGAHHMRGDIKQAVDLYHKAMRVQSRTLRPGHPDLIGSRLSLSRAQRDLGDSASALDTVIMTERTLRLARRKALTSQGPSC